MLCLKAPDEIRDAPAGTLKQAGRAVADQNLETVQEAERFPMDPLPTLDVLLNDATTGKDRLTRAVESAIATAVAELAAIEAFDAASAPESIYQFDRPVTTSVRRLYEAWLAFAEPLEARVTAAVAKAGPMVGSDRLHRVVGRTMARLTISVEDLEESVRDAVEGRPTYSMEEVRRELRLHAKVQ